MNRDPHDPLEPQDHNTPPEGWDAWADGPNAFDYSGRTFAFMPARHFLGAITAPDWTIRRIIEADSLVVLFGDPESGKSFMAMDWAACIATGREWNGHKVKRGPVLYINGEGKNGVNRRFTAWAIANQCPLHDAPLFMSTTTTALTDAVARAEIEAVVAEFVRTYGPPQLIIIDTLARNFGPGDENKTQDMTLAVATCDAIRELTRATVVLVHHSGHGEKDRARGSMVLKGAADAEYRMGRMENGDTTLQAVKMKDATKPEPMSFRFADVELGALDEEGQPVTSAVLKRVEYQAPDQVDLPSRGQPAGGGKNQTKALKLLNQLFGRYLQNVIKDGRDPIQARVRIEDWRDLCVEHGMARNRFAEAMASLQRAGKVRFDSGFAFPEADA